MTYSKISVELRAGDDASSIRYEMYFQAAADFHNVVTVRGQIPVIDGEASGASRSRAEVDAIQMVQKLLDQFPSAPKTLEETVASLPRSEISEAPSQPTDIATRFSAMASG